MIFTESLELMKDVGTEGKKQLVEAGKDIVKTVGIPTNEETKAPPQDLQKLSKEDNALKGAEIAKLKQVLFNEQKSSDQESFARIQREKLQRQQAQQAAEQQKSKQGFASPPPDPGSKLTGMKALIFKNKKETKQQ